MVARRKCTISVLLRQVESELKRNPNHRRRLRLVVTMVEILYLRDEPRILSDWNAVRDHVGDSGDCGGHASIGRFKICRIGIFHVVILVIVVLLPPLIITGFN